MKETFKCWCPGDEPEEEANNVDEYDARSAAEQHAEMVYEGSAGEYPKGGLDVHVKKP